MKTLHYVLALATLLIISSCTERVLSPDKLSVTEIPDFIPRLQQGSYWIYERTHLDSNGTALGYPKTFDSLCVIGINNARTSDMGLPVIELHDLYTCYSENGTPTMKRDTIYWVFDKGIWYVKNTNLNDSVCLCLKNLYNWRVYLNSSSNFVSDTDEGVWQRDTVWEDITYLTFASAPFATLISNHFTNRSKPNNYENITINDSTYKSLQVASEINLRKQIINPETATFLLNNKKHITITDSRSVWCNGTVGMVRERTFQKANYPGDTYLAGICYDRKLIRYSLKTN